MIIGIDAQSLAYGTGVSNYTQNLIEHILKIDNQNQYKIFFSSLRNPLPSFLKDLEDKYSNVKIYHFRLPPKFFEILWNKLHILNIELFIGKCDIFHTSDWTHPPSKNAKTVCTIHDLTPFLFPKWHAIKTIINHNAKMAWANLEAKHFICVSKNTQNDLFKIFKKIKEKNTTVIYEAADDIYNKEVSQKEINNIKEKYNVNNFFLAQGTREPRKNLKRLINAFSLFKEKNPNNDFKLLITGKFGWGKDIEANENIILTNYVSDIDLYKLHASAFCLIYPSLYEGFGLPLIKSMKQKVPIITSNNSSLIEISNNSTLLVNPKSTKSIYLAMQKIFKDKVLYNNLSKKGFENSQNFDWSKTAKQTLEVYKKVYENRN